MKHIWAPTYKLDEYIVIVDLKGINRSTEKEATTVASYSSKAMKKLFGLEWTGEVVKVNQGDSFRALILRTEHIDTPLQEIKVYCMV